MAKKVINSNVVQSGKFPPIVYGLDGIMDLFSISKSTAWRYRHGIIKDACTQNGNVIVVDVRKAFNLFGIENTDNIIVGDVQ